MAPPAASVALPDHELYLLQQGRHAYLPSAIAHLIMEYSAGFEVGAFQRWQVVRTHWLAVYGWCGGVGMCCTTMGGNYAHFLCLLVLLAITPVVLVVLLVSLLLVALHVDLARQCHHECHDGELIRDSDEVGPINWFNVEGLRQDWTTAPVDVDWHRLDSAV